MPLCLGYHLNCARAIELIGEHDTSRAFALMGQSLALLGREMMLNCTDFARNPEPDRSNPLPYGCHQRAASAGVRALDVE